MKICNYLDDWNNEINLESGKGFPAHLRKRLQEEYAANPFQKITFYEKNYPKQMDSIKCKFTIEIFNII